MGIRGIPANYGGFETFAEELSTRLVKKGHEVTVYCRSNIINYKKKYYKGVRLFVLPTISHKYFDTVIHTAICVLHSMFKDYDVILICNSANSIFSYIPRFTGKKVALNVDGLEWQRNKWNFLGKWFYQASEYFATFLPNQIITDSTYVEKYYQKKFNKSSVFIPYGAPTERVKTNCVLNDFGVQAEKYILYVSRLEPENNAHLVVKAFEKTKTDMNLIIVGDAPYNSSYIQELKKTKDPRIIFTGYVFGQGYREFQSNAYYYIQATEVGGTHPALLEAMGFQNCVLANDVPEHREVVKDSGLYFKTSSLNNLRKQMQHLLDNPAIVSKFRNKAVSRIHEEYTWDIITDNYEKLFEKMNKWK